MRKSTFIEIKHSIEILSRKHRGRHWQLLQLFFNSVQFPVIYILLYRHVSSISTRNTLFNK